MFGIVWDIFDFLIMCVCRVLVYGVLITLQYIARSIQVLFVSDFELMAKFFPVVKDTSSVFIIIALMLIFLIFLWQVFRSMGAGILGDAENPIPLLIKTIIFTFLIFYSKEVCSYFMKITSAITTMLWNIDMGNMFDGASLGNFNFTNAMNDLKSYTPTIGTSGDTMFDSGVSAVVNSEGIAELVTVLIIAFLLIAIMWNFLKLILEIGERYVVMCILYIGSPLAFAMGASNSTNQIFKGWCRMFASSLLMMVLNTWSVMLAMSSMRTFVENGANFTFSYYKLEGTSIVPTGSISSNTLVWGILTFAFLKCAQSLDEYLNSMGLSTARTGRGLLEDAFAVGRTLMQTANMVRSNMRMAGIQRSLGNSNGNRGAATGSGAGSASAGTSPNIKFNNAAFNAKPSQLQSAGFKSERQHAASMAGLSDKNINGAKWGTPDKNGNVTGVGADGTPLRKDAAGVVYSQTANGGTAMRAPNGAVTITNPDGSRVSYDPTTQTKTSVSADGTVSRTENANGGVEIKDKNTDTTTRISPDGCQHKTYGENSEEYGNGVVSTEYDPHSNTMTTTGIDGSVSTKPCDNVMGPDAEMNAAAEQNATESGAISSEISAAGGAATDEVSAGVDGIPVSADSSNIDADDMAIAAGVGAGVGVAASEFTGNTGAGDVSTTPLSDEPSAIPQSVAEQSGNNSGVNMPVDDMQKSDGGQSFSESQGVPISHGSGETIPNTSNTESVDGVSSGNSHNPPETTYDSNTGSSDSAGIPESASNTPSISEQISSDGNENIVGAGAVGATIGDDISDVENSDLNNAGNEIPVSTHGAEQQYYDSSPDSSVPNSDSGTTTEPIAETAHDSHAGVTDSVDTPPENGYSAIDTSIASGIHEDDGEVVDNDSISHNYSSSESTVAKPETYTDTPGVAEEAFADIYGTSEGNNGYSDDYTDVAVGAGIGAVVASEVASSGSEIPDISSADSGYSDAHHDDDVVVPSSSHASSDYSDASDSYASSSTAKESPVDTYDSGQGSGSQIPEVGYDVSESPADGRYDNSFAPTSESEPIDNGSDYNADVSSTDYYDSGHIDKPQNDDFREDYSENAAVGISVGAVSTVEASSPEPAISEANYNSGVSETVNVPENPVDYTGNNSYRSGDGDNTYAQDQSVSERFSGASNNSDGYDAEDYRGSSAHDMSVSDSYDEQNGSSHYADKLGNNSRDGYSEPGHDKSISRSEAVYERHDGSYDNGAEYNTMHSEHNLRDANQSVAGYSDSYVQPTTPSQQNPVANSESYAQANVNVTPASPASYDANGSRQHDISRPSSQSTQNYQSPYQNDASRSQGTESQQSTVRENRNNSGESQRSRSNNTSGRNRSRGRRGRRGKK